MLCRTDAPEKNTKEWPPDMLNRKMTLTVQSVDSFLTSQWYSLANTDSAKFA